MGKKSKSKRFIQHGKNSVDKHAERFPYRSTLEEAEDEARTTSLNGGM